MNFLVLAYYGHNEYNAPHLFLVGFQDDSKQITVLIIGRRCPGSHGMLTSSSDEHGQPQYGGSIKN